MLQQLIEGPEPGMQHAAIPDMGVCGLVPGSRILLVTFGGAMGTKNCFRTPRLGPESVQTVYSFSSGAIEQRGDFKLFPARYGNFSKYLNVL